MDNESVYARGATVKISAEDPSDGIIKPANIAVVANGTVELESSLVRDPELSPAEGRIAVISKGDFVIGPSTKSTPRSLR